MKCGFFSEAFERAKILVQLIKFYYEKTPEKPLILCDSGSRSFWTGQNHDHDVCSWGNGRVEVILSIFPNG